MNFICLKNNETNKYQIFQKIKGIPLNVLLSEHLKFNEALLQKMEYWLSYHKSKPATIFNQQKYNNLD